MADITFSTPRSAGEQFNSLTASAGTFSPYTLSILRPLFQRIAMSQRGNCDEGKGLWKTFDADDCNEDDLFEEFTSD